MSWADWLARETAAIAAAGRWREPRDFDAGGAEGKLAPDGSAVVAFASNDYLGLTQHPEVAAAAHAALDRWGSGSGAARLIVGSRPVHSELESALAAWKGTERCVTFPTGFAANLGAITTLGSRDAIIFSDELNHASIIDGARLARAEVSVYAHCDVATLTELLRARPAGRRALVVTDTVFSMDGDLAPVDDLIEVTHAEDALLLVDEAHAVLGPELPALDHVVRVGTLSKTLGALGGFVAGSADACDLIVNRARSYIFTTAPTPADAAAALAAVEIVRSPEGIELCDRLRANVEILRPGHPSPIVPIICGDETRALAASSALLDQGILVPAIRPPTVAPGTCRLRVALSAAHTPEQVAMLRDALDALDLR